MGKQNSLKTVKLKNLFLGAKFGRYAEMAAFYNNYYVITRHYDKNKQTLNLTFINMKRAVDPEFKEETDAAEDKEYDSDGEEIYEEEYETCGPNGH